jgi:hypothetical protein
VVCRDGLVLLGLVAVTMGVAVFEAVEKVRLHGISSKESSSRKEGAYLLLVELSTTAVAPVSVPRDSLQ